MAGVAMLEMTAAMRAVVRIVEKYIIDAFEW